MASPLAQMLFLPLAQIAFVHPAEKVVSLNKMGLRSVWECEQFLGGAGLTGTVSQQLCSHPYHIDCGYIYIFNEHPFFKKLRPQKH